MPYIGCAYESRFYDPIYVHNSDENATYYTTPECFEWIKHVGKGNELDRINWMVLATAITNLPTQKLADNYKPFVQFDEKWDFPLLDSDTPHLVSIYNFLKEATANSSRSHSEQLDRAIVFGSYPAIPNEIMERLVAFSLNRLIPRDQRLKASISERTLRHLNSALLN